MNRDKILTENEWFKKYLQTIEFKLRNIESCIEKMPQLLEQKYITRPEFMPVRLIAYGIAGICLTALLIILIKTAITR